MSKKPFGQRVAEQIIKDQGLEEFNRDLIEHYAWRRVRKMKPESIFRIVWYSPNSGAYAGNSVNSFDDPRDVVKKAAVEVIIGYACDQLPLPSEFIELVLVNDN